MLQDIPNQAAAKLGTSLVEVLVRWVSRCVELCAVVADMCMTNKSSKFSRNQSTGLCFHLFAMIQTCTYLCSSNFTPQVKEARTQPQISNRKSISRNNTHRQSYHLIQMILFVCQLV